MSEKALFLDIGNSRLKIWKGKNASVHSYPPSKKILKKWLRSANVTEVWISSVVRSWEKFCLDLCRKRKIICHRIKALDVPLVTACQKTVGVDRLLGILAASMNTKKDHLVVIDIGTALTVDFWSRKKGHHGGWILPGPETIGESLHGRTAELPCVIPRSLNMKSSVGTTTKQALKAGQSAFLRGLIKEVQAVSKQRFQSHYDLFITGGWSKSFHLNGARQSPWLVLQGLEWIKKLRTCKT